MGARALRVAGYCIAFFVLAAAAIHLYDTHGQDRLLELSHGDPRILAELLIEKDDVARGCSPVGSGHPGEFDVLMLAITIVERFATSRLERLAELVAVHGTTLLGLQVPDLSIGDAQIRVSTAVKALQAQRPSEPRQNSDRNVLALSLLAPCDNRRLGVHVLTWIAEERGLRPDALDRASILVIAAAYNGQAEPRGLPDLVAKRTYAEVVYHLYHALNFALLRRNLGLHSS